MKHVELLKLSAMVVVVPILLWMVSIRSTVGQWREYRTAQQELTSCDTLKRVKEVVKVKLSLMDFMAKQKDVKLLKYNRYAGANEVIINELIVAGDFVKQVKLLDVISDYWDISSVTFSADNTTIIIQEFM